MPMSVPDVSIPRLPTDRQTQAEWWCALNGLIAPPGLEMLAEDARSHLYDALTALPGVEEAGMALWRERWDAGLYPQDGTPHRLVEGQ